MREVVHRKKANTGICHFTNNTLQDFCMGTPLLSGLSFLCFQMSQLAHVGGMSRGNAQWSAEKLTLNFLGLKSLQLGKSENKSKGSVAMEREGRWFGREVHRNPVTD